MTELIPSDSAPDALHALQRLIRDGTTVRAAVAFVTEAGVGELGAVVGQHTDVSLEVVARAADVTSPQALLDLRDHLHAEVSVVIGRYAQRFHPKLWLIETGDQLSVLSGSGNLTYGGLRGNDEQFEIATMPAEGELAAAQAARFERLTTHAMSLDAIEGSAIWWEWLNVIKQQARHRRELERLQRAFSDRDPIPDRRRDKAQLIDDLDRLYAKTVAARLRRADGGIYVPSRFKQGIERARAGADPVRLVTQICRKQSDGFDVLLAADQVDLTVELLVLDSSKPYHDMFKRRTRELSAERLRQFPSWRSDT